MESQMDQASKLWKKLDELAATDPRAYKDFMASQSSQLKELSRQLEFVPEVGFTIETELRSGISIGHGTTGSRTPFFVNVCQSDEVQASQVSLGKRKVKKDKIVVDVVLPKERVQKAKPSIPAREALAKDVLDRILPLECKKGPASFGPVSFPPLLYKGGRKADPHVVAPIPERSAIHQLQPGELLRTKLESNPLQLPGSRSQPSANTSALITEMASTTFAEEPVAEASVQKARASDVVEEIPAATSSTSPAKLVEELPPKVIDEIPTVPKVIDEIPAVPKVIEIPAVSKVVEAPASRVVEDRRQIDATRPWWIEHVERTDAAVVVQLAKKVDRTQVSLFTSPSEAILSYLDESFNVGCAPSSASWRKGRLVLKTQ